MYSKMELTSNKTSGRRPDVLTHTRVGCKTEITFGKINFI